MSNCKGKLEGKTAVITGGNSGIGLATAKLYKEQGASVIITASSDSSYAKAQSEYGNDFDIIKTDVSNLEEIKELAAKVKIKLSAKEVTREKVIEIKSICQHHRGKSPVYIAVQTEKGKLYAAVDKNLFVNPDVEFCRKIKKLLGEENFQLTK